MAWTAPKTWVTGEVVTAALGNTHWRDNLRYLKGLDGVPTIESGLIIDNAGGDEYLQIPSLTTTERNALSGVNGMVIYNETTAEFNKYENGNWNDWGAGVDHGGFDGLGDADHSAYQAITLLTTRGDIIYRNATVWARLAKGTEGQVLRQGADDPEWASSIATHEFMVLPTGGATRVNIGDFLNLWRIDAGGEIVSFMFNIPNDFVSLTSAKVVGIKTTNGNIDWTAITDFGAIGEAYTTHSDSATADGVAMTANEIEAIDVAGAFTGLAADDYVGLLFTVDVISAGSWDIIGLIIKYT